jgi:hypothetical protein
VAGILGDPDFDCLAATVSISGEANGSVNRVSEQSALSPVRVAYCRSACEGATCLYFPARKVTSQNRKPRSIPTAPCEGLSCFPVAALRAAGVMIVEMPGVVAPQLVRLDGRIERHLRDRERLYPLTLVPRYPDALIWRLAKIVGEVPGAGVVVDVGAGTGIFSRQLRGRTSSQDRDRRHRTERLDASAGGCRDH